MYFPTQDFKGITAAWSLCVEMTFYLFIPLYAMLLGRRRSRRTDAQTLRLELWGLLVMVLISFSWRFTALQYQTGHSKYWRLAINWLPAYLDLFALGMGLAVASAWMHHREVEVRWLWSRWLPWVSWACAGVCFWGVSHIGSPVLPIYFESDLDLARQTLYALFAFFLLLPAVFGPQGKGLIRRFLQSWPMASLGVISYGIYLWHETWIYVLLKYAHLTLFNIAFWPYLLGVLGLSIASSSLSYFIVEKPALRLKSSITWWKRPAPATTTAPTPAPATTQASEDTSDPVVEPEAATSPSAASSPRTVPTGD